MLDYWTIHCKKYHPFKKILWILKKKMGIWPFLNYLEEIIARWPFWVLCISRPFWKEIHFLLYRILTDLIKHILLLEPNLSSNLEFWLNVIIIFPFDGIDSFLKEPPTSKVKLGFKINNQSIYIFFAKQEDIWKGLFHFEEPICFSMLRVVMRI